jgi:hypothetical protein
MKDAEIEDFLEGFNQPPGAGCGSMGSGSLPGHPGLGGQGIAGLRREYSEPLQRSYRPPAAPSPFSFRSRGPRLLVPSACSSRRYRISATELGLAPARARRGKRRWTAISVLHS